MKDKLDNRNVNEDVLSEVISACPESDDTDSGVASLPRMTNDRLKKKKIIKNKEKGIQKIRFIVQLLFALLCIWIGIEFYQFAKYLAPRPKRLGARCGRRARGPRGPRRRRPRPPLASRRGGG